MVVDEVLDVLERDPRFSSFTLDGQAILLEDYLELRPGQESRLRALLAEGRLELGPVYVQPDEFLVAGEALVRNLLVGRAVCRRFGAEPAPVAYLPDGFGHPAQLPQILSGFGIEALLFSRGMGDELDDIGVIFDWRAPDGSTVRAFQLLPDYSNFARLEGPEPAAARVEALAERFGSELARVDVDQFLLFNGDDHATVQPELPDVCEWLEQRFAGVQFPIGRYADYVQAAKPHEVPGWGGELVGGRLQNVLRGVNSARLHIKQANERAERRLLAVETLWALRCLRDRGPFPVANLTLAWRELLRCQPHDSICGCSCDEVHRDMLVRFESLHRTLDVLTEQALAPAAGQPPEQAVAVFNPLPQRRTVLVEQDGAEPALVELPGFTARTVMLEPGQRHARGRKPSGRPAIESDRLRIELARDGTLTLIALESGHRFQGLHRLEDEADMGDLYTFCPVPGALVWHSESATARVLAQGPLLWELEVLVEGELPAGLKADLGARSTETVPLAVSTVVRLVRGSGRVEFRTTFQNAARDHRLRAVFPLRADVDAVRAEGQFAVVRRPLVPLPPAGDWVEPRAATAHTLGTVAAGPLALVTKGLPEYEGRRRPDRRAELCLTLVRSVGLISRPSALPTRPVCAGPPVATPEGQCLGTHELEYALLPGADELDDLGLLRASQDYRSGYLPVVPGSDFEAPMELEGDVVFSALMGAQDGDGLILRAFNPSPASTTIRVRWAGQVLRTRLDESGEQLLADGAVAVGPGEIVTVRLRF
jgi:alpha-mannosidase/mannosylglycerate hydrolase